MIKLCIFDSSTTKKHNAMTKQEVNKARNEKGVFSAYNEVAGWYAISRDGINMITFSNGVIKFYTETGFAKRITKLLNTGY